MNENVVDILIFLYENYLDSETPPASHNQIHDDLIQAGFPEPAIDKAFDWMDGLMSRQGEEVIAPHTENPIRIYTDYEQEQLDVECRGFLLFLEQSGILDPDTRELVIDRALALEDVDIGEEELKWIALVVLVNQPGQESACAQMENLVYDDWLEYLH